MTQAMRLIVRAHGGPEVIEAETFDPGQPGPGEVLIAQDAIGLNFIDTYVRSGLYPAQLPTGVGVEAAGVIAAVGDGVSGLNVGDRVAYGAGAHGSYTTHRIFPAARVVKLPDGVSTDVAAALLMKGMTACFLVEDCAKLQPGQSVLVHSAAGGVGSILVPWLHDMGVTVIAHAGSPEKAERARVAGADHALSCPFDALAAEVRALTGGIGVDVALDGVGKDSWAASLGSLRRRGLMVTYGNASGPVPPISVLELSRSGSLFCTRPTLYDYIVEDADYQHMAARLFDRIERGVIASEIGQRFALKDAADAHRALEARQTTGSTILVP